MALTFSLDSGRPYHLGQTMSLFSMGLYDPTIRLGSDSMLWAMHTPEGPATVEVLHRDKQLQLQAWGDGGDWLLVRDRARGWLGLNDDPSHFQPTGKLRDLARRFAGMHLPQVPTVFARVIQIVLLQLVSWSDANRGWRELIRRHGNRAPGPHPLMLEPAASFLQRLPYYEYVDCGILPRQARTIKRIAAHARQLERAADQGPDVFAGFLGSFHGIGEWTVQYALGSALGQPDALLTGDYGTPHAVAWYLAGIPRSNDEEMVQLLAPYAGHRWRVVRLIWQAGINAPRRGPKMRSIRERYLSRRK